MAYKNEKNTTNPFLPKVSEKWHELTSLKCKSFIETIVKNFSLIIVLLILVALIPIGAVISIYNTIYNLQKKAYDELMVKDTDSMSSQFATSVEFGIYILLSLPFLLILLPYWIIAVVFTWLAKNKTVTIVLIIITLLCFVFWDFIQTEIIGAIVRIFKFGY